MYAIEKCICNLYDKKNCYSHKNFETRIKSWISSKKVHIQFNKKGLNHILIGMLN